MKNENKKKKSLGFLAILLLVLFGAPLAVILLAFIAVIAPFLLIGYVFKMYFDYREIRLKAKLKLEYKLKTRYS